MAGISGPANELGPLRKWNGGHSFRMEIGGGGDWLGLGLRG